ncbi:hypothetical protein GGQ74_002223 [Desulfobaculum xiamenense]|uniref:Uncharacterized protein n=1 Tax=Desulfobaculum xiamenense TaxID=995050 RepID=A0A846QNF5_9BACT|nr:hypothetical protein [Desulfobaculum xiamenense]NJB68550.1 hypothetical protein [Desulfobaculum xiamenense]
MGVPTAETIIPVCICEPDDYLCDVKQVVLHLAMKEARNAFNNAIRAHCRHYYKPRIPHEILSMASSAQRWHAWARLLMNGVETRLGPELRDRLADVLAERLLQAPMLSTSGIPKAPPFNFSRFLPLSADMLRLTAHPTPTFQCPGLDALWADDALVREATGDRALSIPPQPSATTLAPGWDGRPEPRIAAFLDHLRTDTSLIEGGQLELSGDRLVLRLLYRRPVAAAPAEADA